MKNYKLSLFTLLLSLGAMAQTQIKGSALIEGVRSTATAAGTTTLVTTDQTVQVFTGTTTQSVALPVATTLSVGRAFEIHNASTGIVTVKYTDATTLAALEAGTNIRLRLISSGTSNGTWRVSALARAGATRSVTATDTATNVDSVLILSGASFTQNLFTAVGNTGKELNLIHAGTMAQIYTIDPSGAQTLGGASTYTLNTPGETLRIVSDGSNWKILGHHTDADLGALTTTTNFSNTTITTYYWRRGSHLIGNIYIAMSGAAGTHTFQMTLPSSLSWNSTPYPLTAGSERPSRLIGGSGSYGDTTHSTYPLWPSLPNSNSDQTIIQAAVSTTSASPVTSSFTNLVPGTVDSGDAITLNIDVAISGWNP